MDELGKRGEDISRMEVLESVEQTVTVPESKDPRHWWQIVYVMLCYVM
jgi:hypothetical protein